MVDTKNQNQKNLDLTIEQFEFAKKQKQLDSLDRLHLSIQEDSLNQLRDSLTKYQISLYKTQDEIMQRQLEKQNTIYENQTFAERPKISISVLKIQPSGNWLDTIFFEMHNKGEREAHDVLVKIYYVNMNTEYFFTGPELNASIILPKETQYFFAKMDHEFINKSLEQNDFYLEVKYHFLDPLTHKIEEIIKVGQLVYEHNNYQFSSPSIQETEKIKSIVSNNVSTRNYEYYNTQIDTTSF